MSGRAEERVLPEGLEGEPTKDAPQDAGAEEAVLGAIVDVHGDDEHDHVGHEDDGHQQRPPLLVPLPLGQARDLRGHRRRGGRGADIHGMVGARAGTASPRLQLRLGLRSHTRGLVLRHSTEYCEQKLADLGSLGFMREDHDADCALRSQRYLSMARYSPSLQATSLDSVEPAHQLLTNSPKSQTQR